MLSICQHRSYEKMREVLNVYKRDYTLNQLYLGKVPTPVHQAACAARHTQQPRTSYQLLVLWRSCWLFHQVLM